ncbi:MAG: ABC transporter ATP-binding protein [Candidatus Omnitrophica bacterium]|nr:ABC transporter ATP-binding protein [Candidatus Omnitrophota bacterium]
MPETVIEINKIGKKYPVMFKTRSLLGNFLSFFGKKAEAKYLWALQDISFSVKKGETVGIIGENASGKTTLLRIISGITSASEGTIKVKGKVAGLLDLGAGVCPELTGRENIYLDASLYGLSRKEIDACFGKIVEFSGLGRFIEAQVKTYSQGMLVRLGFSVAVHADPDIFLIDDSLAVGDEEFQRRCLQKIAEFKQKGKTIVIVSHDLDSLSRICERGLLLKDGNLLKDDFMQKAVVRYVEAVGDKQAVACIDKGRLSVIFNAGRIILLWDGVPLTRSPGIYNSIQLFDGKWIMSWQAQWQVVENDTDSWKASGVLERYGLEVTLSCIVTDERSLKFITRLKFPESIMPKKSSFGLVINEQYTGFLKENRIEQIKLRTNADERWTDILRTDECGSPLMLISEQGLPALMAVFSRSEYKGFGLLQTAGTWQDARIMQMQVELPPGPRVSDNGTNIIDFASELFVLEKDEFERAIQKRQKERIICSKRIRLQLNDKSFHLFYDDISLSVYNNLTFGFMYEGCFFDLFDGQWWIKNNSSDTMTVCVSFKQLKIEAELVLSLTDNAVNWRMEVKTESEEKPDFLLLRLYLTQRYEKYFNVQEEKEFLAAAEHDEQVRFSRPECGFIGLLGEEKIPVLVIKGLPNGSLELQNAAFNVNSRILADKRAETNKAEGSILLFDSRPQVKEFILQEQKKLALNTLLVNEDFSLEFGGDKISIYYRGKEVTAGEGLCSGIYYEGRWHESINLPKQFEKSEKGLKVRIKRQIPELEEFWNITLKEDEIHWGIELDASELSADMNCKAGIILNSDFQQWVHSFNSGEFCDGSGTREVVDLNDVNNALLGAKTKGADLPALFFERKVALNPLGIIIQDEGGQRSLSFKFRGVREISDENRQEVFSAHIRLSSKELWESDISRYRLQNFSLVTKDGLQLFVAPNKVRLLFKDRQLTEKDGLRVSLVSSQRDFDTYHASWVIKKIGEKKISVQLKWKDLSVEQKWVFVLEDGVIEWSVMFAVKERFLLKELYVHMFLGCWINQWTTGKQKGEIDFCPSDMSSITLFDNRSDLIGLYRQKVSAANPIFVLNPMVNMNEWFLHIYKSYKEKSLTCGVNCVINREGIHLAAGRHQLFRGKIFLLKAEEYFSKLAINGKLSKHSPGIHQGKLSLLIDKAKVRLYWKEKELTAALGLFTAFLNNGSWINSALARWQSELSSDKAVISLCWNTLSVSQKWHIYVLNEREISWQVDTCLEGTEINSMETILMLNKNYDFYRIEEQVPGEFPVIFEADRWNQMGMTKEFISVSPQNRDFPKVVFKGTVPDYPYYNIVENSDALHASRVLRCEAKIDKKDILKPVCFKVNICIEE